MSGQHRTSRTPSFQLDEESHLRLSDSGGDSGVQPKLLHPDVRWQVVGENRDRKALVLPVQKLGMLSKLIKDWSCAHLVATRSRNAPPFVPPFFSPIISSCALTCEYWSSHPRSFWLTNRRRNFR